MGGRRSEGGGGCSRGVLTRAWQRAGGGSSRRSAPAEVTGDP